MDGRSWRWTLGAATLLLTGLLLAGCAAPASRSGATPPDLVFVIPVGTAAARMRGESVVTIPERMTLTAGQSVVVRNEDSAMHYFFYAPIAPGQTFRKTFGEPGRYGYSGFLSCSVADFDSVSVEVQPAAPGR
jgi:plastocyanin